MNKLRLGLSSLMFPITMARFYWEALERRDDIELFTVGPFFDTFIPWCGGMHLDRKYVKIPTVPLPKETANRPIPYEMVMGRMPKDLDLFLMIDAGWRFTTRPLAKVVALVETDPHVLKYQYVQPKKFSDFVFCMQTPYMEADEHFLPYACDTHNFYPEEREMKYDACLIGLQYPQRSQLVSALRKCGLQVFYDTGLVYDEYRNKYNESRVCLNWSSLDDLPSRVWEGFGMRRPVVSNRITDLSSLFVEDEHYLGFSNVSEAVSKVTWLLDNPDKAAEMADRAYKKVIAEHTWDIRIGQLLQACGVI